LDFNRIDKFHPKIQKKTLSFRGEINFETYRRDYGNLRLSDMSGVSGSGQEATSFREW